MPREMYLPIRYKQKWFKGAMAGEILYALLSNCVTQNHFSGVFEENTLHEIKHKPSFVVCGVRKKHWIVIYFPPQKKKSVEIFDSMPLSSFSKYPKRVRTFVKKFNGKKKIKMVSHQLQPNKTKTCGLYCLLFIYYRCKYFSFETVVNKKIPNDKALVKRVFKIFEFPHCVKLTNVSEHWMSYLHIYKKIKKRRKV